MTRLLLALYPRSWRATYGKEYAALLEETRLTPSVVVDVVLQAAKLHARVHRDAVLVCMAIAISACCETVAVHARLTANILWPPTTGARAVALLANLAPWVALAVRFTRRRRRSPASS